MKVIVLGVWNPQSVILYWASDVVCCITWGIAKKINSMEEYMYRKELRGHAVQMAVSKRTLVLCHWTCILKERTSETVRAYVLVQIEQIKWALLVCVCVCILMKLIGWFKSSFIFSLILLVVEIVAVYWALTKWVTFYKQCITNLHKILR